MVRISKLSDYGIQLMAALARGAGRAFNARDLSQSTGMPGPTVRKLLKLLSHSGLLASTRGAHGGYRLGREASSITVEEIIATIEGPVAMTECNAPGAQTCERRDRCPVKANWQQVNRAIHSALEHLTLSQMAGPLPESWSGGPANGESP